VSAACPCGLSATETTLIGTIAVGLLVMATWVSVRAVRHRLRKRRGTTPTAPMVEFPAE